MEHGLQILNTLNKLFGFNLFKFYGFNFDLSLSQF